MSINSITVSGRIGRDPEMRYFENGTVLTEFPLAINKWDKTEQKEVPIWFKVVSFGKLAERMGEHAKKGCFACVEGSFDLEEWEKDGQKGYKLVIKANNVDLVKAKEN